MPGKPNRPLFELLPADRQSRAAAPARSALADAAAGVADGQTQPRAERQTLPRIEVIRPDIAAREPPRDPGPARAGGLVRFKLSALYLALAGVVALAILVWVIAFSRGKAVGTRETERKLGVLAQPAQPPTDPLNTPQRQTPPDQPAGQPKSAAPRPPAPDPKPAPGKTQSKPQAAAPATALAGVPAAQILAGTGDVLTLNGRSGSDPRQAGYNYLVLGIMFEEDAAEAMSFLSKSGFEAFAVPNRGDRRAGSGTKTAVLIASRGLSRDEAGKTDPVRIQTEEAAGKLGSAWKKAGGTTDFRDRYWQKFER